MSREVAADRTIDRRTVLKASLLAGGGLALEVLIPAPVSAAGLARAETDATSPAQLSAFIAIAPDGTVTNVPGRDLCQERAGPAGRPPFVERSRARDRPCPRAPCLDKILSRTQGGVAKW